MLNFEMFSSVLDENIFLEFKQKKKPKCTLV